MLKTLMIALLIASFFILTFQQEGFAVGNTPPDMETNLKNATEALQGNLNLGSYRSNYVTMTTDMVKWTDLSMLDVLTSGKKDASGNFLVDFKKFNDLATFKQNIIEFNKSVSSM
jgi:hypothetical protein